jgi:high-affinity Fe2+/Pb2+ permease
MSIIDTVLFGMLAGLVTLKVALLAAAAMLLVYGLTAHARQHKAAAAKAPVKHPGLDLRA